MGASEERLVGGRRPGRRGMEIEEGVVGVRIARRRSPEGEEEARIEKRRRKMREEEESGERKRKGWRRRKRRRRRLGRSYFQCGVGPDLLIGKTLNLETGT